MRLERAAPVSIVRPATSREHIKRPRRRPVGARLKVCLKTASAIKLVRAGGRPRHSSPGRPLERRLAAGVCNSNGRASSHKTIGLCEGVRAHCSSESTNHFAVRPHQARSGAIRALFASTLPACRRHLPGAISSSPFAWLARTLLFQVRPDRRLRNISTRQTKAKTNQTLSLSPSSMARKTRTNRAGKYTNEARATPFPWPR